MKRCPECRRDYTDETLSFCLDDGTPLLDGPATMDEPATAILSEPGAIATGFLAAESATKAQINTTDQTLILPSGSVLSGQPTSHSEHLGGEMRNNKRTAAVGLAVFLVATLGLGYWFFNMRSAASEPNPVSSIAVLPFQNKGGDADTDYLSDGIAESLIYRLSQLPNLKVSPTSSVIRYKGRESDVGQIAKELEVDAVMSGRIVQRGENLMVSVELVDARTKKLIWGEQYDRKMSDLLTTQREIAAAIIQKLQLKLAGSDTKGITKKYTDNSEAYQLWLKGRFYFARRTKDDMFKGIELYNQAIKLDPNFALAYVGIAESYSTIPSYPYASPHEFVPQAKAAVAKALELDPDLPEAHTVAGMIAATHDWDYPLAEREFKRSLELDPNLAITHYRYAWVYLSPLGRHDEAVAEMKRAMELEPLAIQQGANYAVVLMYARRFDEALEQAKKTNELDPTHIGGLAWLAHTYNAKGMYKESLAVSEKALNLASYQGRAQQGISYAIGGQREDAMRIVNDWKQAEKAGYVMVYWLAATYAQLGDKDAAFAELEKSYQQRDWFLQRLKTDPFMEPFRDDPRYKEMLKRLNLPD